MEVAPLLAVFVRKNLRRIRIERKLSISQAAQKAGISGIYLRHLEDGTRTNPSSAVLQKLALAYECAVADFFVQDVSSQATKAS